MTRSEELRLKYPVFRYERLEIQRTPSQVTAKFHFSVPPDLTFMPEVHFGAVKEGWNSIPDDVLDTAIFNLGLIESLSYWKATASPVIEVIPGGLSEDQL